MAQCYANVDSHRSEGGVSKFECLECRDNQAHVQEAVCGACYDDLQSKLTALIEVMDELGKDLEKNKVEVRFDLQCRLQRILAAAKEQVGGEG